MAAPRLVLAAALIVSGLALPAELAAHRGFGPWLEVAYSPEPGQGMLVVRGDDLEAAEEVALELLADGAVHPLGETVADQEGHFIVELPLPAQIEDTEGYVQVETSSGWIASMWVELREGATVVATSAPAPAEATESAAWLDPAALLILGFIGLLGAVVLRTLWRSRAALGPPPRARRR